MKAFGSALPIHEHADAGRPRLLGARRKRRYSHPTEQQGPPGASFNHLVSSGEERRLYREAECRCGLQNDHKIELGRLVRRELAGRRSLVFGRYRIRR